jgi:hypothetical protein
VYLDGFLFLNGTFNLAQNARWRMREIVLENGVREREREKEIEFRRLRE